jgi:hypothetical protein
MAREDIKSHQMLKGRYDSALEAPPNALPTQRHKMKDYLITIGSNVLLFNFTV